MPHMKSTRHCLGCKYRIKSDSPKFMGRCTRLGLDIPDVLCKCSIDKNGVVTIYNFGYSNRSVESNECDESVAE